MTRFEHLERIGKGGMGTVWKAWDTVLDRWVALKHCDGNEQFHEARIAAQLNHPGIAAIYDVVEHDGKTCICMAFVDGHNLDDLRLTTNRLVEVIRDASRAVEYAHQEGVIHRDLKPENIMVDSNGTALVMDFGLSSRGDHQPGEVCGTPPFISPLGLSGGNVGPLDDVFSLGMTLKALCKQPPLKLQSIIRKATAVNEQERYQSALDLSRALDGYLSGLKAKRRILMGIVAVVLASLLSYLAWRPNNDTVAAEWHHRAEASILANDDRGAVEAMTNVIETKPDVRAYLIRSFAYWRLCDYKSCRSDIEKALQLDPGNPDALHCLRQLTDAEGKKDCESTSR